ncbi:MAG: hypothetical protein JW918_01025 [Anaerolineae bacterium]|nr:hypothetical protein [Anaerolineae bacterium]
MDFGRLVREWCELGPVAWAEHRFGWVGIDGAPIQLEPWQRAALGAWWELREVITTLGVSNIKKTGKTLLDAVLTAWRWLALPGEHYCAANDLDQSAGRQFAEVAAMVRRHPLLRQHVTVTKTKLTFGPTGSTLEALATDYAGAAGSNHLTASHTEAWAIIYEGGVRLWEELTPPPGRFYGLPALRIADSYAGWEDESNTWHDLVDRGLAGERVSDDWPIYKAGGLLLFHIEGEEAQRRCFRGTAEDREAYYREQGESLRAGTYSRLHLNLRASGESRFIPIELWDALLSVDCKPVVPGDRRPLYLGCDAGTKRDSVALVGCAWSEARQRVELALVREWKPALLAKLAGGVDLDETIGAEVLRLHREHNVRECRFDPWQFASIANRLQKAGVNVIEMPQTAQRTEADQALYDAITAGTLATFASPALREAIRKAAGKETLRGYRIEKRAGDDLAVALSMANFGALTAQRGASVAVVRGSLYQSTRRRQDASAAIRRRREKRGVSGRVRR